MGAVRDRGPQVAREVDVLPDGRMVGGLAANQSGTADAPSIHIVLNWNEELKARVPAR